jgi:hypothetical protein
MIVLQIQTSNRLMNFSFEIDILSSSVTFSDGHH